MVRLTALSRLWTVAGFCGLYGSYAGAVVAKPRNGSSSDASPNNIGGGPTPWQPRDRLETSQTRINAVEDDGPSSPPDRHGGGGGSANRAAGKDYGGGAGAGGYQVLNTYGPPRDYYYDERPEYFRPPHQVGSYPQSGPAEVIYHEHPYPQSQYYGGNGGGGGGGEGHHHRPGGELDIKPLLWPLAGITLLGVLSALVKTPLLLHLGAIGHRRRRNANDDPGITAESIESLLDEFKDKDRRRANSQECLVCDVVASVYDRKSTCVERSVCEVMSRNEPSGAEADRQLLTTMIARVVGNDQIPREFKRRLEWAETSGRNARDCRRLYPCGALETTRK